MTVSGGSAMVREWSWGELVVVWGCLCGALRVVWEWLSDGLGWLDCGSGVAK
jgi:hypothetical protein